MEEGEHGTLEGLGARGASALGSRHRSVRGDPARARCPCARRGVCCGGAALRWPREPPPARGLARAVFPRRGGWCPWQLRGLLAPVDAPVVMLAFAASGVQSRAVVEALQGPRTNPTSARDKLNNFLEDLSSLFFFLPLGRSSPAFVGIRLGCCLIFRECLVSLVARVETLLRLKKISWGVSEDSCLLLHIWTVRSL